MLLIPLFSIQNLFNPMTTHWVYMVKLQEEKGIRVMKLYKHID